MSRCFAVVVGLFMPMLVGGIVFGAAGRFNLPMVWSILCILSLFTIGIALTGDRGMMRERLRPGPGNRDQWTRRIGTLLLFAHWILAGLDVGRFHWSAVPEPLQLVGVVGYALSLAVVWWAVRANPFYSSVVRIQMDRGHYPIASGPYRLVRHPGYAATILAMVSGALALGSWIAFVPVVGLVALFIRRTLLEDRLLQRELAGYVEYAQRVRHRLIVGVF